MKRVSRVAQAATCGRRLRSRALGKKGQRERMHVLTELPALQPLCDTSSVKMGVRSGVYTSG